MYGYKTTIFQRGNNNQEISNNICIYLESSNEIENLIESYKLWWNKENCKGKIS